MTAAETLRKARATMECWEAWPCLRLGTEALPGCEGDKFDCAQFPTHLTVASALLDGFTVEELTEAGG